VTSKYASDTKILKSDELRELTKTFTSIDEQRVLNSCLTLTHQGKLLSEDLTYNIDISNYAIKCGLTNSKAYLELKDKLNFYLKSIIDIPCEGTSVLRTHILADFKYDDIERTLRVRFNKEILPLLSGEMTRGTFCYFDARMDNISSNKRYLMAELIQRNLWRLHKDNVFVLSLTQVRESLNLNENEYILCKDIMSKIIKPTLKEFAILRGEYLSCKKYSIGFVFKRVTEEEFNLKNSAKVAKGIV
jgi:hypothetical protein